MKKWLNEIKSKIRQWWPNAKPAAVAAGIVFLLSIAGCGAAPGGWFIADPSNMSPEQLGAMKGLGYDAVRCGTVKGGPPVGGTITSVTFPKERAVNIKFIGCDVQSIEVGK